MAQAMTLFRAGRERFRDWRRTRPFWGGLLLVVAGIELLVAPAAQSLILPIDLIVYAGVAGVSGTLIGFLLIALGVLSWLQPAQNVFFGLVGVMLSLASFVTSNFGGFVIGMLVGIVGGALVFAWGPKALDQRRARRARKGETSGRPEEGDEDTRDVEDTGTDVPEPAEGTPDTPASEPSVDGPGRGTRPLAALALPLAVAVALTAAPTSSPGWPWDWLFPGDGDESSEEEPEREPSPEPSDGASVPPERPDPGEGDGDEEEEEEKEDDGREEDEETDEEEEDAAPEDCDLRVGDSAVVEDEDDFLEAVMACRAAEEAGDYPEVMVDSDYDCFRGSVRDSGLTADSLAMFGARYEGVVECPTADGPRRYIRITMSSTDLEGGELWFDDAGSRRSLGLPTMNLDGDVELHVTSMHVRILGIPLTFTPDFPPPLLLPIMYVTDVDVGDPMASTDLMTIPGLDGRYGGET
ncbi:DUF6114 domain-containing protein [Nocardiopsis alba]|uniref:DUF6114 domain-containing protein n=1 Tax=Nocardiopsis alba TaxID=53437 RepID=UPI0033DAC4F7